jgi:aryl carrier-like protein
LEELGARVLILKADTLNLTQMQEVIKKTHRCFGPVNGIIYAAGIAGGGMIQLKTRENADSVLAPKVKGIKILETSTREEKLDFLVLCSSLASIWGGVGRVDYCAANVFLDAYAYYNHIKHDTLTTAINWDMWQEVGMGLTMQVPANLSQQRQEILRNGILSSEGMEVFERILHAGIPQVAVSTWELQERTQRRNDELRSLEHLAPAPHRQTGKQSGTRPQLPNTYIAPRSEFEKAIVQIWQRIFGIDNIGVNDDFFQLGGHSLLATQLLNRLQRDYTYAELSLRDLFDNPTVAQTAQLIEKSYLQKTKQKEKPVKELFFTIFPTDRVNFLEKYFKEKIAKALAIDVDQVPPHGDLKDFDLESVTTDLIWELKRDFQLPVYPHEILKKPSIKNLARFAVEELEWMAGIKNKKTDSSETMIDKIFSHEYRKIGKKTAQPQPGQPIEKNKPMAFILSSPRTGSTLLRLMLAGHPALLCPPELGLLMFRNMNEWAANRMLPFSREGIVTAMMELMNIDADQCKTLVEEMKKKNTSIQEVYHILQQAAGDRLMVDKTPRYAMFMETLTTAEEIFRQPKYIHLIRHPYPVIQSFVRNRFEKLFTGEDVDPYLLSERIWTTYNRNILEFSKKIDAHRYHLVPYEDLVREPKKMMKNLCEFLGISFEESTIKPYDGKKRMIGGPGDPNIFQHDKIESNLGDVWKKISLPRPLSKDTQRIAAQLGYILPQDAQKQPGIAEKIGRDEAHLIMENIDTIPDEKVDELLAQFLKEGNLNQ